MPIMNYPINIIDERINSCTNLATSEKFNDLQHSKMPTIYEWYK